MTMRSERLGETPSQTVGPYLHIGLTWEGGNLVVPRQTPGAIHIIGTLYDGVGQPIADGLIETWQADPAGRFDHDDDPRGAAKPTDVQGFTGFARASTVHGGRFEIVTVNLAPSPPKRAGCRRRTWTCRCSPAAC